MRELSIRAETIDLEPANATSLVQPPSADRRPRLPEPPPVSLVTVEDASLPAPSGIEVELDWFYREMLQFEREPDSPDGPVFRASNFRLRFSTVEPPVGRDNLHPLGIIVENLHLIEAVLLESKYPFTWQKGLSAGSRVILLLDPAGNWIELVAVQVLR